MAEIEIGIMSRQALGKPLPDLESFKQQVRAWTIRRNAECAKINWQFKTQDARIKLAKLSEQPVAQQAVRTHQFLPAKPVVDFRRKRGRTVPFRIVPAISCVSCPVWIPVRGRKKRMRCGNLSSDTLPFPSETPG